MREFPLTEKQIQICNHILKNNNKILDCNKLYSIGHNQSDLALTLKFLLDNKIISVARPIVLTEIGTKYLNKGIVKYFKDQRRDEFLRSPIMLTFLFFIPVIISVFGVVINYNKTQKIEDKAIDKNEIYNYIDSVVQARSNKLKESDINKQIIDTIPHDE